MAEIKICLLISEDPDDQLLLSQAISDAFENIALTIMIDGTLARELLQSRKIEPDFLVVDPMTPGLSTPFHSMIDADFAGRIPVILYTDGPVKDISGKISAIDKNIRFPEFCARIKEAFSGSRR